LRNPQNLSKLSDKVFYTIIEEIEKHKIPYTIFFRLIDFESGFTFITNVSSGAFGYCQVMPSTWNIFCKSLKLTVHDEIGNIKMGAHILKLAYDSYKRRGLDEETSWFRALVDYSGGSQDLAKKEMMYYKNVSILKKEKEIKI
jgi:soluble lytic murein transglycosylase-like protein